MPTTFAAKLARPGVWCFADQLSSAAAAGLAHRIEELGYSALWLPETTGRDPFAHIAHLADSTDSLLFATGIANVYNRHPGAMKQAANTLLEQTANRFLLGLGVSHARTVTGIRGLDYSRPLSYMQEYLKAFAASPYSGPASAGETPVILAALGPKMMQLAAQTSSGVHTYSMTAAHTATARAVLGPDKLICVEQKVILASDRAEGRSLARKALGRIIGLPNYRRGWLGLGISEDDIENMSDTFIDMIVPIGDEHAILERLQEHYAAGATHVCINPLNSSGSSAPDLASLETLASVLGDLGR